MQERSVDCARTFVLCAAVASAAGMARADVVDVELNLLPPSAQANRLTIRVAAAGMEDSDTADLTGSVETRLWMSFDPISHTPQVAAMAFEGGRIFVSDMEFEFFMFLLVNIDGQTQGVSAVPGTTPPVSLVTDGQFPGEDHLLTFDQGTLSYDGTALGTYYEDSIDLSAAPMDGSLPGTGSLEVSLLSVGGGWASYSVDLAMPIEFSEEVASDPLPVVVSLENGTLVASGAFARPIVLVGDADGDGDVDDNDLSRLLAHWGDAGATWGQGEFTGQPPVDDGDLSLLLANWTGPIGASVPEPTTMGLLIFAAPVLVRRRAGSRPAGGGF